MRIYYSKQSLIFKGFTRYWRENGPFNKWFLYGENKKLKRDNPIEFKNRNRYSVLEDNEPLCYYGKQYISIPRKFIFTLKRFNLLSLSLGTMHKNDLYQCLNIHVCTKNYAQIIICQYLN